MKSVSTVAGLVVTAAMALGCAGNPIGGSWENDEVSGGAKDELTIDDEGGTRTIEFTYPLYCGDYLVEPEVKVDLEISWNGDADKGYDLEFECTDARISGEGGCEPLSGCDEVYQVLGFGFDVEVECEINDAEDELDCEYEDESFTYERTGE